MAGGKKNLLGSGRKENEVKENTCAIAWLEDKCGTMLTMAVVCLVSAV
jgi:hypothetical protein